MKGAKEREAARALCVKALTHKNPAPDVMARAQIAATFLVAEALQDIVDFNADAFMREASRPERKAVLLACPACFALAAVVTNDGEAWPVTRCTCEGAPVMQPFSGPASTALDPMGGGG